MRKKIAIFLSSMILIFISACGNNAEPTTQKNDDVTVRIGVLRGSDPLSLAQEGGPLQKRIEEAGANLDISGSFPALAPAIEALTAGSIDITIGSITASNQFSCRRCIGFYYILQDKKVTIIMKELL